MSKRDLEKQFESKYNDYGNMLFKIAYLYTGNSADAEDILQDVFMKYLSGKYRFKDEAHEKAWFIRVTQNKSLDYIKRSSAKNISLEDIDYAVADDGAEATDILRKVLELPEKYKSSVILYYYYDYSVKEIAKTLKISVSAVKMRLKRSREILKLELEDYV